MKRRLAVLLVLAFALSGCASLGGFAADDFPLDDKPTPAAEAPTPAEDYSAGQALHARGDDAGARARWTRCVEESPASAPEHLDCLVAIESLVPPPPSSE
jgi:hypothetical protein